MGGHKTLQGTGLHIQQIRNAMVRISYAGKTFLTAPWLAAKGGVWLSSPPCQLASCLPPLLVNSLTTRRKKSGV